MSKDDDIYLSDMALDIEIVHAHACLTCGMADYQRGVAPPPDPYEDSKALIREVNEAYGGD